MSISARMTVLIACMLAPSCVWSAGSDFSVRLQVDLQQDVGQNFGTLFEAVDAEGNVVAGAGYVGSYNTQSRSDRRNLHFFVKSETTVPFDPRPLARPAENSGTYLFEFDDRLYSRGRGGSDRKLRVWNPDVSQWNVEKSIAPFSLSVGHGVLTSNSKGVSYNGQPILSMKPGQGALGERYYANGPNSVSSLRHPSRSACERTGRLPLDMRS